MAKTTDNRPIDTTGDSSTDDIGIANDSNGTIAITEHSDSGCGAAIERQQQIDESIESRSDSGTIDRPADPNAGIGDTRKRRVSNRSDSGSSNSSRGKPSTGTTKNKLDLTKQGQNTLALQVKGVHEVLGLLTGLGEMTHISNEEAEQLTQAVLDVCAQYKIKPNPKVVAWCNLAGVLGIIYAPRVWLIMELRKQNAVQQPQEARPVSKAPVDNNVFKMNF